MYWTFLLWKHNLILLLQMIYKENKNFRKMFIVTEYAALIEKLQIKI